MYEQSYFLMLNKAQKSGFNVGSMGTDGSMANRHDPKAWRYWEEQKKILSKRLEEEGIIINP